MNHVGIDPIALGEIRDLFAIWKRMELAFWSQSQCSATLDSDRAYIITMAHFWWRVHLTKWFNTAVLGRYTSVRFSIFLLLAAWQHSSTPIPAAFGLVDPYVCFYTSPNYSCFVGSLNVNCRLSRHQQSADWCLAAAKASYRRACGLGNANGLSQRCLLDMVMRREHLSSGIFAALLSHAVHDDLTRSPC